MIDINNYYEIKISIGYKKKQDVMIKLTSCFSELKDFLV